jgi:hypothetical protein
MIAITEGLAPALPPCRGMSQALAVNKGAQGGPLAVLA